MIRVSGLTKDYGIRRAIDSLTFEAEQGAIVGFLGPNGAGKTTTMRILSGYMPPTEGEATVAGYDVVSESIEVRRRVGYLPETVPLYTDMTVFDYLKFMADLRHLPNWEERIDETLEMVGMEERADGYIGNLSKGMRQRIGLAQALLHKPEVLILDEPTIGLDPGQVVEVRNVIREIGKERTVLLSTHILADVERVCDVIGIIAKGRLIAQDRRDDLLARYVTPLFEIEVDNGFGHWLEWVKKQAFVTNVTIVNHTARVLVKDIPKAQKALLESLAGEALSVRRFEMVHPSLEDVFLRLTEKEA